MARQIKAVNHFGFENMLRVSIDFSSATWNTATTHEVFTCTGAVWTLVYYKVTESLTSGGAATISFGDQANAARYAAVQTYSNLAAGNHVAPGGTVASLALIGTSFHRYDGTGTQAELMNTNGLDYGYSIASAAMTDGTIEAVCFWTPMSSDGLVVAGAGGTL